MQVLFGNSHARAHERAYEAAQEAADEQERYEAWIDEQADSVLRAPFVYMSIREEAEACIIGGNYEAHQRAAYLALMAGDIELAKSHAAAGKPVLEREIKDILRVKTPKSQWRKQQELCYEY